MFPCIFRGILRNRVRTGDFRRGGQNGTSGGGCRPLSGRGTLRTVRHRHSILPFRRAEMRTADTRAVTRKSSLQSHSGKRQCLPDGGTGSVYPVKGNAKVPQSERGTDTLIKKVSGKDNIHILRLQSGTFQATPQHPFLHNRFGFFPCFFPEKTVVIKFIEPVAQRSKSLLLSANVGTGTYHRRICKFHRLPPKTFILHDKNHLIVSETDFFICGICIFFYMLYLCVFG